MQPMTNCNDVERFYSSEDKVTYHLKCLNLNSKFKYIAKVLKQKIWQ